jgi:hypothetical protein
MNIKQFHRSLTLLVCLIAALLFAPGFGFAQTGPEKLKTSMDLLRSAAGKLGIPRLEGADTVAGKEVAAIYFGTTKINNNFDLVDDVVNQNGGIAAIFVKSGKDYVRIATNVKNDDGSRDIGTVLDPKGPVFVNIRNNKPFFGEAIILGKPYISRYEPIRDAANRVVGVYHIGFPKE